MPIETRNRVVCTGCCILCDDIACDVQFDTIQKVHNACLRGSEKISFSRSKERLQDVKIQDGGTPGSVSVEQGMKVVHEMLRAAKNPLIMGLAKVSNEAQDLAFSFAKKYKATIAIPDLHVHEAISKAVLDHGISLFTLGEAINNADLLLFWGANPIDLAPKLIVKSVFSRGRYRATGKEVKKFVVIDEYQTPTMERADIRIVTPDSEYVSILASIIDGVSKDGTVTEENKEKYLQMMQQHNDSTHPLESSSVINDLVKIIELSEYATIFIGEGILNTRFLQNNPGFLDVLLEFAKKMNDRARMAILPLFYRYNQAGLYKAMRNFHVENLVDASDAVDQLDKYDLVISFGADPVSHVGPSVMKRLGLTRIVAIDYKQSPTTELACIVFPSTITGIDSGGTVTRFDGTSLVLNPSIKSTKQLVSDEDFLKRLLDGQAGTQA